MHNNTRTHNQPAHNPEKKGESGAINKLTENEDENADDTCGCDSARGSGLTQAGENTEGHRLEDSDEQGTSLRQPRSDDKKGENTSRNPASQELDRSGDDTSENAAEDSSRNPNKKTGPGNDGQTAQSQNQKRPGTPKKNAKGPSVEAVTEEDD